MKQKLSILMVPVMALYVMLPCVSQAAPVEYKSVQSAKSVASVPPTESITYFYNGSTLMNAEDDNSDMSTYLDRTVRTIVNVNTQTVLDTQCLFTDGKNVISQTDSSGTTVTSTHQYNAFGQPVNDTSPLTTNGLSIATNPFQYDGYYNDSESGLYYLNARYYSPTLMQFISMDTYDLANRYSYSDGNPIGNEDPTGHSVLSWMYNNMLPHTKGQIIGFVITAALAGVAGGFSGYFVKQTILRVLGRMVIGGVANSAGTYVGDGVDGGNWSHPNAGLLVTSFVTGAALEGIGEASGNKLYKTKNTIHITSNTVNANYDKSLENFQQITGGSGDIIRDANQGKVLLNNKKISTDNFIKKVNNKEFENYGILNQGFRANTQILDNETEMNLMDKYPEIFQHASSPEPTSNLTIKANAKGYITYAKITRNIALANNYGRKIETYEIKQLTQNDLYQVSSKKIAYRY